MVYIIFISHANWSLHKVMRNSVILNMKYLLDSTWNKKHNGPMGRVFANGPGDLGSIPGCVIPKTLKWYLIPPCLTLSNIRYLSRVKWSNPGKGVAPAPTPRCRSYWKGSLLVALDYSRQHYLISLFSSFFTLFQLSKLLSPPLWICPLQFVFPFNPQSFCLLHLVFYSIEWFERISVEQCSCVLNSQIQLMLASQNKSIVSIIDNKHVLASAFALYGFQMVVSVMLKS